MGDIERARVGWTRRSADTPRANFSPDLPSRKWGTGVPATKNRPGGNEAPRRLQSSQYWSPARAAASAREAILPQDSPVAMWAPRGQMIPADHDAGAPDHVGGALLAFRTSGHHLPSCSLWPNTRLPREVCRNRAYIHSPRTLSAGPEW
jgi:hypothetical protein